MDTLETALRMLEAYPLCDHCLGRQFALLGHGLENSERGRALKLTLTLKAHDTAVSESKESIGELRILAANGFFDPARQVLQQLKKRAPKKGPIETCYLCENVFLNLDRLVEDALGKIGEYEFTSFLVGVELPASMVEREDEFKGKFEVAHGENLRNELGRVVGKRICERSGKIVDHLKPEIVVLVNPAVAAVRLQVNPLFIAGRYRKLVRGIPQSKWFCSNCRGKGCQKCGWTGKMYAESVEEIVGKRILEAVAGGGSSFHASGREDIDARMLGAGRPFVIEIAGPMKRFLDLGKLEEAVNAYGTGKVEVSGLKFANKDVVRKLKQGENAQKQYRVMMRFGRQVDGKELDNLEQILSNVRIKQRTPLRVMHRRADLTREKYIYEVKVKKLSSKKAEMELRCQGGLYVKELVSGDEGRTVPSVAEILKTSAQPLKLDVLNIILGD